MSEDQATGALLADEILERARRAGPPLWGQDDLTGTRTVILTSNNEAEFVWQLRPHKVENSDLGSYFQLEVEVSWHGEQKTMERGRQSLVRTRFIYLDDF
ncbi:MAG: hypothetical protein WC314_03465 [Vulcanimicrobiota bacterium]